MQIPSYVHVKEKSWLARCAAWYMGNHSVAMVFRNYILLWGVTRNEFEKNTRWVKHEMKHVEQYARLGTPMFILAYIKEWLIHGYYNNKFEIEARAAESKPQV